MQYIILLAVLLTSMTAAQAQPMGCLSPSVGEKTDCLVGLTTTQTLAATGLKTHPIGTLTPLGNAIIYPEMVDPDLETSPINEIPYGHSVDFGALKKTIDDFHFEIEHLKTAVSRLDGWGISDEKRLTRLEKRVHGLAERQRRAK